MVGWDWDVMVGWLVGWLVREWLAYFYVQVHTIFCTMILAIVYALPLPLGLFYCVRVKPFQVGMSAVYCMLCLDAAGNINMN